MIHFGFPSDKIIKPENEDGWRKALWRNFYSDAFLFAAIDLHIEAILDAQLDDEEQEDYINCVKVIDEARDFLVSHPGSPSILLKIARNAGDTIHGIPILRHYRIMYPDATIVYLCEGRYSSIHKYNEDITPGGLFKLPSGLTSSTRVRLWDIIKDLDGIDVGIMPAVYPHGMVHFKDTIYTKNNIAEQIFLAAGIGSEPAGGREYVIKYDDDDKAYALDLTKGLDINKCILCEYVAYTSIMWHGENWERLIEMMPDYHFIGVAGKNEPIIPGMIDARGCSWRETVALADLCPKMIGVGSGVSMLAAGAANRPQIYELAVDYDTTLKNCGYAPNSILATSIDTGAPILSGVTAGGAENVYHLLKAT